MIGVGQKFPEFSLKATVSTHLPDAFVEINSETYQKLWKVFFFWPKDFTFVCPTEIHAFSRMNPEFAKRDTQVLGCSVDSEFVHLAWRKHELKEVPFPMLSDIKKDLSAQLGIIDPIEGVSQRATYIVDPENIIRFVMVTDLRVGRNTQEILRILDALQTNNLCPCNWEPGQEPLRIVC